MFIVSPLSGGGFASLFSTHPAMEERIARLEAMAKDYELYAELSYDLAVGSTAFVLKRFLPARPRGPADFSA